MPWTFYLYVTNGTARDLVVKGSQLNWGYWYRDNSRAIPPAVHPVEHYLYMTGKNYRVQGIISTGLSQLLHKGQ